ncbi:MAG TPA: M20/M25/M40 family metallo-hydrolase [Gaiellaceae bacterium]|nr:M20/M25/M40 family metallo-hydrolase [Gaiellaceae bacterium]
MAAGLAEITDDALRITDLLCRQPSVSAEERALGETADLVEELLVGAGFTTRQLRAAKGPPAVYGELRGSGPHTLLLYNHYDVQPVDPLELWETAPFEPDVRDGKLFARGVADNKGELAVRLATIRALRERDARRRELPIGLRWIVEGEEEVGSPHFAEIVEANEDLLAADACLWEGSPSRLTDGRPSVSLGYKGALGIRLDVRALATDAHSAAAAVAPSAAWRLTRALASLRDAEDGIAIAGFHDDVLAPSQAELQAIQEASDSDEEEMRSMLGIDSFLGGVSGAALRERASFTPTCNIAGLKSGYSGPGIKTVLPATASAWMDMRLVPDQTPQGVLDLLRAHLERHGYDDVEITVRVMADPARTPVDHPFVQRVIRVAEAVSGQAASVNPLVAGTLPIVAPLQRIGVPGVSAPDNPFYWGSRIHAPNEHVKLDDVHESVRFMIALVEDYAA